MTRSSMALALALTTLSVACSSSSSGGGSQPPPATYGISGTVSGLVSAGVTVSLTGAATASTTTDASGNYSFTGLANGAYTVTPSLAGYTFTPANAAVTVSGASVTGKNFTSTGAYAISGTVSGAVAAGVTVSLSGAATGSTTTDAAGAYSFTGLANGAYTVTPSLGGYTFAPVNAAVTVAGASVTGKNFTATAGTGHAISGTVSGLVSAGVAVSLSGAATASTTTDAAGNYSFAGVANGSYTVTPTLAGYTFSPASTAVTVSGADVTGTNFTSTGAYAISGTVSGLVSAGVTVTLSGAGGATRVTDASGNYSFTGLVNGTYYVTPSLAGYAFSPASATVTVSGASVTGKNFTSTGAYAISGTVSGVVAAGVTMSLSGAATASITTDASGNYSFTGLANGAYTVTPSLTGYTFTPANAAVTVSGATVTGKNFTSTGAYAISGAVSGAVAAGVTVSLSGAATASTTTDASGNYSFTGVVNGAYTVTPTLTGYTFSPINAAVTVAGASVTGKNFTATAGTGHAISGTVSGLVASGVTVSLSGAATASTITDASGNYSFTGVGNGSYTVTPSLTGYAFSPVNAAVTVSGADVTGTNFTSIGAYAISGTVSGLVSAGVTVTLSGAGGATRVTDASGNYSFTGLVNGTYYVTPSLAGYAFSPASATVVVAGASVTGKNFTSTGAYAISGTVSGVVAAGVTVNLTGASTASTTTDATGAYSFTGLANGAYTVTPSLAGYTFTPASAAVTVSGASVTGKNFTSAGVVYSVSGTVTGAVTAGVTVKLTGTTSGITTTDGSGNYSFGGLANGASYTVTPSLGGYSFPPASASGTIALASATANFNATSAGPQPVTLTGTVAYSGTKTGRVFVNVAWQNQGNAAGGTSLATPGAFTIHGVQSPGTLPANIVVTAWIDTLGIDRPNVADPYVATTVSVTSTSFSLGTLTLADQPSTTPAAPTLQGAAPADGGAAVIYNPPRNANGVEAADHYRIYWSTTPSPGPANKLGMLTVPAGPGFGIVQGLTNGTAYYLGVDALSGTNASPVAALPSAVTVGPPSGPYAIAGTVNVPALPAGTNVLYVVAQSSTGPVLVGRYPSPASAQPYSILVPNGTYQMFAFVDLGNDGIVNANEPGLFGSRVSPIVTVSGAGVAGPTLAIPGGNVTAGVATSHQVGSGWSSDQLEFQVGSNLKLPMKVQVTAGPGILAPLDAGLSTDNNVNVRFQMNWVLSPAVPVVGDTYTLAVTYSDGTSESLPVSVTAFYTATPTLTAPAAGATGVGTAPTFAWTAPVPAPAGTYVYNIGVWPSAGGYDWYYGPMPSSQLSVPYNADGQAAPLTTGTPTTWTIEAMDAQGNRSSAQSSFTP